jgi:O-antigen ligase
MCLGVLLMTPAERLARIPLSWPLWTLLAWQTVSFQWTEIPYSTLYLIRAELLPLACVSLIAGVVRPEVLIRRLIVVFSAIVIWSLFLSFVPKFQNPVQPGFRGTFDHKNELGIFSVFTLCMVLAFVRGRMRPVLVLCCVLAVMGTRSATAASGLFAVLFIWFWMSAIDSQKTRIDRSFLRIVSLASLVIGVMLAVGLMSTFLSVYGKDVTFSGRTIIWNESITTVLRQPVQGYGLGGVWLDGRSAVTADLQRRIGFGAAHAHNGAIELLLEVGVVGLVCFLLFFGQTASKAVRSLGVPARRPFGQWALLTISSLLLMSLSEPLFTGSSLAMCVIVWVVLATNEQQSRQPAWMLATREHLPDDL